MTAIDDIRKALSTMPPVEKGKRRFVLVGRIAMQGLRAGSKDPAVKPAAIGNSNENYGIVETDQFDGWEIVDRDVSAMQGGGGKWPPVR